MSADILAQGVSSWMLSGVFLSVNFTRCCDVSVFKMSFLLATSGGDIALLYPLVRLILRNVQHMGEGAELCHKILKGRLAVCTLHSHSIQ